MKEIETRLPYWQRKLKYSCLSQWHTSSRFKVRRLRQGILSWVGVVMALLSVGLGVGLSAGCADGSGEDAIKNHLAYLAETLGEKKFYIDNFEYQIAQQVFTPRLVGSAMVIAEEAMPPLSKLHVQYHIVLSKDELELKGMVEVLLIKGEGVMQLDVLMPLHDVAQVEVSFSPMIWYPVQGASLSSTLKEGAAIVSATSIPKSVSKLNSKSKPNPKSKPK